MNPVRRRQTFFWILCTIIVWFGCVPSLRTHAALRMPDVRPVPELKVVPGGQTIGVRMKSAGVLVVGHHSFVGSGQQRVSPGERANIQIGDLIVRIDGKPVADVSEVAPRVEAAGQAGRPVVLTVLRGGEWLDVPVRPEYDAADRAYRLGLYIRDTAAGVGTLTFYSPDFRIYGALGHVVTDTDTRTPIVVGNGEIVAATVTSIARSRNGEPGEKHAVLPDEGKVIGTIEKNTAFGIFGRIIEFPSTAFLREPMPVAFADEVQKGPAEMWTVIDGQKVEKFGIEIVHVARQQTPGPKGLVVRVTDPRLIEKTGGIVQGMSGSPIVQNGKLVGAVTHVLVSDPTTGYGCLIEWMLRDAGLVLEPNVQKKAG